MRDDRRARLPAPGVRQLLRRGGAADLGTCGLGLGQQNVERRLATGVGDGRLDQLVVAIDRRAHQAIELGARHRGIAAGLDRPLPEVGDMHGQVEDVGIGHHAGVPPPFGAREVLARRFDAGLGRPARGLRRHDAAEHLGGRERERRGRFVGGQAGDVAASRGGVGAGALPSAVEDQLLDTDGCHERSQSGRGG